jgi:hypothetical protein
MFLFSVFLLTTQAASASPAASALQATVSRTEAVMNQTFTCMDTQAKEQLKAQILDATPESVVEAALNDCAQYRQAYETAAANQYISQGKASELADNWFVSLKEAYIPVVERWLRDPVIAESRTKVGVGEWRKCVTDKATDWSRTQDEAATVARAAVTSCASFRPKVQAIVAYELRTKNLPRDGVATVMASIDSALNDVAVQTVVSERAKRLNSR